MSRTIPSFRIASLEEEKEGKLKNLLINQIERHLTICFLFHIYTIQGYIIAKNKHEYDRMEYYAAVIQKLQNELGLRVSSFPNIGLSALKFFPLDVQTKDLS